MIKLCVQMYARNPSKLNIILLILYITGNWTTVYFKLSNGFNGIKIQFSYKKESVNQLFFRSQHSIQ